MLRHASIAPLAHIPTRKHRRCATHVPRARIPTSQVCPRASRAARARTARFKGRRRATALSAVRVRLDAPRRAANLHVMRAHPAHTPPPPVSRTARCVLRATYGVTSGATVVTLLRAMSAVPFQQLRRFVFRRSVRVLSLRRSHRFIPHLFPRLRRVRCLSFRLVAPPSSDRDPHPNLSSAHVNPSGDRPSRATRRRAVPCPSRRTPRARALTSLAFSSSPRARASLSRAPMSKRGRRDARRKIRARVEARARSASVPSAATKRHRTRAHRRVR